jgi:hypothetical protein
MIEIIDFDSTVFDLIGFTKALPQAVQTEFGVDASTFESGIKSFYVENICYDIYAHLNAVGVDLSRAGQDKQLITRILDIHKQLTGQPDLLFSDARALVRRHTKNPDIQPEIMTVNLQSCFDFKRRLCGQEFADLPARVVTVNKGSLLTSEWASYITYGGETFDSARIIDDSPNQIEAAPNRPDVERIQIVRPNQKYRRTKEPNIRVVSSLDDIA